MNFETENKNKDSHFETLSAGETRRYNRHIILPEIGSLGQLKLKNAKVLVVGAGGLGCPVLMYLAAAGVGNIGIIDFDKIDESNLQRQILYSTDDIGKYKAEVAKLKLSKQNPYIQITSYTKQFSFSNAIEIAAEYDVIVDGTDNFSSRYLLNDVCIKTNKPLVAASIFKFEGQLSVYNYKNGPTYRCLFPEPPTDSLNCSEIGVIGVLPGILGTLQANEVIKIITGIGKVLSGRLLFIDALTLQFRELEFEKNTLNSTVNFSEDKYDYVKCETDKVISTIKEITPSQLKQKLDSNEQLIIIDVREKFEYDICNLNGVLIPLNELEKNIHKIPRDKNVIIMCHHGRRSRLAIELLQQKHNYKNLLNLSEGINGWSMQIDNTIQQY
ncbi:MAG: hypothetical protein A3F72_04710 [Bacteroidetes bacterium RIFCSPLOWO2_12_FULL_35_15]|nr:MAG: hypothetical protein A3F72_04710 [Bacteroidetes bacterium RIFCSPLOWO2_12_FULL_35_15]